MKGKAILREADNIAEIKNCEIKDGKLIIGNREFILDLYKVKIMPLWVKKFFGYIPMFDLKWNCLIPSSFNPTDKEMPKWIKKELVPVEHSFVKTELPELLRETADWRFMKELKRYAEEEKRKINIGRIVLIGAIALIVIFILMNVLRV